MITTVVVAFLMINGMLVIPVIHIPSPLENLQNQLKQIIIGSNISDSNLDYDSLMLSTASYMGTLPVLNLEGVNSFEQYHDFVDKVNDAIKILNSEKLGMQIPLLQYAPDEYDKISKIITKFLPLIQEYNDMISAAKNVHALNQDSINNFYIKTGIFSVMLLLVVTAAYAAPSYWIVGTLYRSSGLTTMAFKCPSCVSVVLSEAHWAVRSYSVEATANVLDYTLTTISKLVFPGSIPKS